MIDALIAGRRYCHAEERAGNSGAVFVTCKMRSASGSGESVFSNVIAFNAEVRRALLALDGGDSVVLSPKVWRTSRAHRIRRWIW